MDPQSFKSWLLSNDDPWMDFGDAVAMLHAAHPRTIFLKTLRRNSSVLDVGAGDGTLQVFKTWLSPRRDDLRMYAYAMQEGPSFAKYEAYELGCWPKEKPNFGGLKFDAIVAAHFIEHLERPLDFVKWAVERLNTGGRLYIEWPSDASGKLPNVTKMRNIGVPLSISNFYDDSTHFQIPRMRDVVATIISKGCAIDQQGVVSNPFAEDEVRAHLAQGNADDFALQAIFWSKTKWAQYIVASAP